jgi:hypothetical protein
LCGTKVVSFALLPLPPPLRGLHRGPITNTTTTTSNTTATGAPAPASHRQ